MKNFAVRLGHTRCIHYQSLPQPKRVDGALSIRAKFLAKRIFYFQRKPSVRVLVKRTLHVHVTLRGQLEFSGELKIYRELPRAFRVRPRPTVRNERRKSWRLVAQRGHYDERLIVQEFGKPRRKSTRGRAPASPKIFHPRFRFASPPSPKSSRNE